MNYSSITVLYNPISTGPSKQLAESFASDVTALDPQRTVSLKATERRRHAEDLAYTYSKEGSNPLIISSSGDGGYNEVVNGIMKASREGFTGTAGLLPAGNANDHYHNLHSDDFIENVVAGTSRRIDLLSIETTVDGKPFQRYGHSYIGFGLTPVVGNELNKNTLNVVNQVWIVMKALLQLKSVKLNIDGKARHYDSIIISNIDKMSKVLKISQPSAIADGVAELTIFRKRSKLKLIRVLLKASLTGVKEDTKITSYALKTVKKTIVQIDGEVFTIDTDSAVRISVEKQVLPCVI